MKKKIITLSIIIILILTLLSGCFSNWSKDRNTQIRTIIYDDIERTYRIHIPPGFDQGYEGSLVFVLHGGGGTARGMENYLTERGFNELSDEKGFIVVYPEGYEKHWNDGRKNVSWNQDNISIDDVGFLDTLIENILNEFNLNRDKVFFCGISNGGQMSYRMACEKTEKIAGIATVVASFSEDLLTICAPSEPIPVFITSGTMDPLVPYEGGEITLFDKTYGKVISVNETVKFWIKNNNCSIEPIIDYLPDIDPNDEVIVRTETYLDENDKPSVILYCMEGGGHIWPGGPQYYSISIIGKTCNDFDACEKIWDFFKNI